MVTDLDAGALTGMAGELGALARAHDVTLRARLGRGRAGDPGARGRFDVLVNNAGVFHAASLQETTPDAFRRVMDVNATGVFLGMRGAAPPMVAAGSGVIINISSAAGLTGPPTCPPTRRANGPCTA